MTGQGASSCGSMTDMRTVFVIGGMGSGKSTLTQAMAANGVPVLDLDTIGHEALREPAVCHALVDAFGTGILDGRGHVDRASLAACAFADPSEAATLSRISAPFILESLHAWLAARKAEGCRLCVIEASAFDGENSALADIADCIVAVCAPQEARVLRAMAKGFTEEDVLRRLSAQASDEQRRHWADLVVENAGTLLEFHGAIDALGGRLEAFFDKDQERGSATAATRQPKGATAQQPAAP